MKKIVENRYEHSATLFKFCKEALKIRYSGSVKVIDQDVGALLGYDPADCSHWKKGKKNIRTLANFRSIADYLGVDQSLVIDMVFGKVSLEEGVFEYKGYADFELTDSQVEAYRKDFFQNPSRWNNDYGQRDFDELFNLDRNAIGEIANKVISQMQLTEPAVQIDDVFALFDNIKVTINAEQEKPVKTIYHSLQSRSVECVLSCKEFPNRPYLRFLVAKELYKFLVFSQHELVEAMPKCPSDMLDVQGNFFAGSLLIPRAMLLQEVNLIDSSIDFIDQLASIFQVSKLVMNRRMQDYLVYKV